MKDPERGGSTRCNALGGSRASDRSIGSHLMGTSTIRESLIRSKILHGLVMVEHNLGDAGSGPAPESATRNVEQAKRRIHLTAVALLAIRRPRAF